MAVTDNCIEIVWKAGINYSDYLLQTSVTDKQYRILYRTYRDNGGFDATRQLNCVQPSFDPTAKNEYSNLGRLLGPRPVAGIPPSDLIDRRESMAPAS